MNDLDNLTLEEMMRLLCVSDPTDDPQGIEVDYPFDLAEEQAFVKRWIKEEMEGKRDDI